MVDSAEVELFEIVELFVAYEEFPIESTKHSIICDYQMPVSLESLENFELIGEHSCEGHRFMLILL